MILLAHSAGRRPNPHPTMICQVCGASTSCLHYGVACCKGKVDFF
jgi:hypothetical protein